MVQIPRWQVILILAVLLAGLVFALPNVLQRETAEGLPGWVPSEQVNLGLDLQGGSYLLLEAEIDEVIRKQVENLVDSSRSALRQAKIGYTGLGVSGEAVVFSLRDASRVDEARQIIREFGNDVLVSANDDGEFEIRFTDQSLADSDITGGLFLLQPQLEQVTECADGIDNDSDGTTDSGDPGCADASDLSERDPTLPCDDGADSDGDGFSDYHVDPTQGDPGCRNPTWPTESPQCQDGLHNDGDGLMDYDGGLSIYGTAQTAVDPQCAGKPWRDKEIPSKRGCGLGFEAALTVAWLARRRRRAFA